MKKIIAMILTCVSLLGLTACGSGGGGDKELYVAAFKGAYGEEFLQNIADEFEKAYASEGYTVKIEIKQNIEDTVKPQITSGKGPDVMYLPMGQEKALTEGLIKSESLLDLTSLLGENVYGEDVTIEDKILDSFVHNMATDPYNDGKTYMLPLFYSPVGVFYNKNLFNADGSDGKYKLPETVEDLLALKSVLDAENSDKAESAQRKLFVYPGSGYMREYLYSSIASATDLSTFNSFLNYEDVYSNANFKQVFTNTAALKGYTYATSWDTATNYKDIQNVLLQNKALFMPCGTWLPNEMADYTPATGFEYGFMAPVKFDADSTRYATAKLEQIYILKQSKKQDIAKKFLQFIYSDTAIEIIARDADALVPTKNALAIAEQNGYLTAQLRSFYDIYSDGSVKVVAGEFASANVPGLVWADKFNKNIDNIMKNTKTVDGWISDMRTAAAQLRAEVI